MNSGLPENSVRSIAIDGFGRKWVGTDYGLAVFNDTTWTVYQTSNSGLPDNTVRSVVIDKSGAVWAGTFNGGLAKFDGISWTVFDISNSLIPDNYVRSLAVDTSGAIWVGTIGGLAHFDGTTWENYTTGNSVLGSNNIGSLYVNKIDNFTAVGTINGGITIVDTSGWETYNIWNSTLPDNTILGSVQDSSGALWIATPASGLAAYVGTQLFLTLNPASSAISSASLTCIDYAGNDVNWIGSLDSGLIKKSGLNFTAFTTLNSGIPDNVVQCVVVDSNNVVWVGTQQGGLARFNESLLSGINATAIIEKTVVYPNPATDRIYVQHHSPVISALITALDGTKRCTTQINADGSIDVSNLSSGIYLLELNRNNYSKTVARFAVIR
ncbi:MAG TPA: two-component regulator propeller domain-containing protein [Bacteroidia bacterium]|nr:two-component regulator propeller domain-containing protein [Bacteroidia bacterium]